MEFFAPEAMPQTSEVGKDLLIQLRESMSDLEKSISIQSPIVKLIGLAFESEKITSFKQSSKFS